MKAATKKTVLSPVIRFISLLLISVTMAACNNNLSSFAKNVEIGDSVVLQEYTIACNEPSQGLNRIATSSGKDLRDLEEKLSQVDGCYNASHFEKGRWEVLAINGSQLLIKMPNYSGRYWVSDAQVLRGEPEVIRFQDAQSTVFR